MAEWSPLDLSPVMWFDASDATTLYDATTAGSNTTDGDTVLRWEDLSGNGNHLTIASAGPNHRDESFNGNTSLEFNGTSDYMTVLTPSGLLAADDKTIVGVFDGTANGNYNFTVSTRINAGGVDNSSRGYILYYNSGTVYSHLAGGSAEVAAPYTFEQTRHILVTTTTATTGGSPPTVIYYADGDQQTLTTDTITDSVTTELTNGHTSVGRQGGGYAGGLIGELVIFDSVISAANRQKLEGYLSHKWGVPLVSGHPYANKHQYGGALSGGAARGIR